MFTNNHELVTKNNNQEKQNKMKKQDEALKVIRYDRYPDGDPGTIGAVYCSDHVKHLIQTQKDLQWEKGLFGLVDTMQTKIDFWGNQASIGIAVSILDPAVLEVVKAAIKVYVQSPSDPFRHKYYVELRDDDEAIFAFIILDWNPRQDFVICYSFED